MQELDGNSYNGARAAGRLSSGHETDAPRALVFCEAVVGIPLDGSHDERRFSVEARRGTWHQTTAIKE